MRHRFAALAAVGLLDERRRLEVTVVTEATIGRVRDIRLHEQRRCAGWGNREAERQWCGSTGRDRIGARARQQ